MNRQEYPLGIILSHVLTFAFWNLSFQQNICKVYFRNVTRPAHYIHVDYAVWCDTTVVVSQILYIYDQHYDYIPFSGVTAFARGVIVTFRIY